MSYEPEEQDLFLKCLLEANVDGILAFDRECRYTTWNRAMERISGLKREDVVGKNAFELFPCLKETGEDKRGVSMRTTLRLKADQPIVLGDSAISQPVSTENGLVLYMVRARRVD